VAVHVLAPRSSRSLPAPRSLLAPLLAALAVALPGCRDHGPVALDELDDPVLTVSWYHGSLGEPLALPHFYVQVSPRQDEDECLALDPAVEVSVGDDVLDPISLGGWVTDEGQPRRCTIPTFVLPGEQVNAHPREPTTTVALFDGASRFGVVARGLFVERSAELEQPAGGELHVGERAVVAWRPATDQLGLVAVFFYPQPAPGEAGTAPSFTRSGPELELDGDRIAFRVPAVDTGPGTLRVEASADVPTEDCHGFRRCDVAVLAVIRDLPVQLR
jgi:hypothetical protein